MGSFAKTIALCHAVKCSSWFYLPNSAKKCCSLQCTADTVRQGLPACWDRLSPFFQKEAKSLGQEGKRKHRTDVCQLHGTGEVGSGVILAEDPELEAHIHDTMSRFDNRPGAGL